MSAPPDPQHADWASLTSLDLLVSLRVPRGWEVEPRSPGELGLAGPRRPLRTSRPTMTLRAGVPDSPGRAWFEAFALAVPNQLELGVEGIRILDVDRYELSSAAEVVVVTARSIEAAGATGRETSHLQAYVWAGSYRMLEITGRTTLDDEGRDLPVLAAVVASLRLLPPRPKAAPPG